MPRARAFVDVGEPITISRDLVRKYAEGGQAKHDAVNDLLKTINMSMYQVTTMAPDWNTLNCVNTARHILTGKDVVLTTEQKLKLNRNLVNACKFFDSDKEVTELRDRVADYQDLLSCTHQTDFNISKGVVVPRRSFGSLLLTTIKFLVCGILCIPGLLLSLPGLIVVSIYSSHYRRNALRKSTVKISAMDVLATGKLVSAAVCFIICILVEPAILLLCCNAMEFHVTILDYLGVANILPWLFYLTIFLGDYCTYLLSELRFGLWSQLNPKLDKFLLRQREQLKTDLNAMIEKKGPEMFGSEETFEQKRVLKDGMVSLKRVNTSLSLSSLIPESRSFGNLAQEVIPHIFY